MFDPFNRNIHYMRISVADRCNMRCRYCMPEEGVTLFPHDEIIRYEEIIEIVKTAVTMGFDKFRLTGGEPLIRRDILGLVCSLAAIPGVRDLSMTTNGMLLGKYAQDLYDAGIKRINISLDTLNPDRYSDITRGGRLQDVLEGIDAAIRSGFKPVKLNCVITESTDAHETAEVEQFAKAKGLEFRTIRKMNLQSGEFWRIQGGDGGHCSICNRVRVTSNGHILSCLFGDQSFSIRELGIRKALEMAVSRKPECGTSSQVNRFHNIGG